jgi:hypothetical protein
VSFILDSSSLREMEKARPAAETVGGGGGDGAPALDFYVILSFVRVSCLRGWM